MAIQLTRDTTYEDALAARYDRARAIRSEGEAHPDRYLLVDNVLFVESSDGKSAYKCDGQTCDCSDATIGYAAVNLNGVCKHVALHFLLTHANDARPSASEAELINQDELREAFARMDAMTDIELQEDAERREREAAEETRPAWYVDETSHSGVYDPPYARHIWAPSPPRKPRKVVSFDELFPA